MTRSNTRFDRVLPWAAFLHDLLMAGLAFVLAMYLRVGDEAFGTYRGPMLSGLPIFMVSAAVSFRLQMTDRAEARIHGSSADEMLFHAAGQIDAILDVAGTCIAIDLLDIGEIRMSAFPIGHGTSRGFPNPGPVALDLMRGCPLRTCAAFLPRD